MKINDNLFVLSWNESNENHIFYFLFYFIDHNSMFFFMWYLPSTLMDLDLIVIHNFTISQHIRCDFCNALPLDSYSDVLFA